MKMLNMQQNKTKVILCLTLSLLFETSLMALGINAKQDVNDTDTKGRSHISIIARDRLADGFKEENLVGQNSPAFKTSEDPIKKDLMSTPWETLRAQAITDGLSSARIAAEIEARHFLVGADEATIQKCISPIFTHKRQKSIRSSKDKEIINLYRARGMALQAAQKMALATAHSILKNEDDAKTIVESLELDAFGRKNEKGLKKVKIKKESPKIKQLKIKTLSDLSSENERLLPPKKSLLENKGELLEKGRSVATILGSIANVIRSIFSITRGQ